MNGSIALDLLQIVRLPKEDCGTAMDEARESDENREEAEGNINL